ncbi:FAD-dependent oxidoreductase [Thermoleptolyngbya sichuanensis]|uniref:FAD-dependent oxidoreductase n=1 Tax=Thermoleptolyngbya sichuanensis TaxID=2885951 RepID=UPI003529C45B
MIFIAGLAAYELAECGHRVKAVLEASDRVGQRIYTYRFNNSTHRELGAMRVGQPDRSRTTRPYLWVKSALICCATLRRYYDLQFAGAGRIV